MPSLYLAVCPSLINCYGSHTGHEMPCVTKMKPENLTLVFVRNLATLADFL